MENVAQNCRSREETRRVTAEDLVIEAYALSDIERRWCMNPYGRKGQGRIFA